MINNWPGVLTASLAGFFMLHSVIKSLQSGRVTTPGKHDRQVAWYREHSPGKYWSALFVEILCVLFCFGSAYTLAYGNPF